MKNLWKNFIMMISSFLLAWSAICLAQWWDYGGDYAWPRWEPNKQSCNGNTNLWDCVDIKDNNSLINRLLNEFWLNDDMWSDHKFINYAKAILNIALWLLSMIALVMTIYTFYMMFFTDNEAWIKKAKWNLVGIFIALGIIWLARLIVSVIFRWYQSNWKGKEAEIPTQWNLSLNTSYTNETNAQIYPHIL